MEIAEDRPPYVVFETRAVEDREASIAQGFYCTKDVDFALITPVGTKDRIEREVAHWFASLDEQVAQGRFKREWLIAYKSIYKDWKSGEEIPENGFPIKNWMILSPSQTNLLIGLNVRTVEDLAAANDETLGRIGMGAMGLKQKAQEFLASQAGAKSSVDAEALTTENAGLRADNEKLAAALAEANNKIAALTAGKKD